MTMRAFWRVKDHLYGLHGPLLIALAAVFVYARTFFAGFIWDDDFYVWNNPTLKTLSGIFDIWFRPLSIPQYYPLVHTTYWLEYRRIARSMAPPHRSSG